MQSHRCCRIVFSIALGIVAFGRYRVNKFKSLPGAAVKVVAQLQPNVPNPAVEVDALDIAVTVNAFKGFAYPYAGPAPCPP